MTLTITSYDDVIKILEERQKEYKKSLQNIILKPHEELNIIQMSTNEMTLTGAIYISSNYYLEKNIYFLIESYLFLVQQSESVPTGCIQLNRHQRELFLINGCSQKLRILNTNEKISDMTVYTCTIT